MGWVGRKMIRCLVLKSLDINITIHRLLFIFKRDSLPKQDNSDIPYTPSCQFKLLWLFYFAEHKRWYLEHCRWPNNCDAHWLPWVLCPYNRSEYRLYSHTGLKWHESEQMMTEFSFLGDPIKAAIFDLFKRTSSKISNIFLSKCVNDQCWKWSPRTHNFW